MHLAVIGLTVSIFAATSVEALQVTPQPATPHDEVQVEVTLPVQSCFNEITEQSVSINGTSVSLEFIVEPVTSPICPLPPPLRLTANLGRFTPGTYQLEIVGTINGDSFGPLTTEFEVVSGVAIPLFTDMGRWIMALGMLMIGAFVLRAGRAIS